MSHDGGLEDAIRYRQEKAGRQSAEAAERRRAMDEERRQRAISGSETLAKASAAASAFARRAHGLDGPREQCGGGMWRPKMGVLLTPYASGWQNEHILVTDSGDLLIGQPQREHFGGYRDLKAEDMTMPRADSLVRAMANWIASAESRR
jgi:hypothetical protein